MMAKNGSQGQRRPAGEDPRGLLLAGIPVRERRLHLGGISTAVLEGGDGPVVVLLHGPAGSAADWIRVIPDLVTTHRVVAPDLPGQGASEVFDGPLDADRVFAWVGELIERTCPSPPTLVGLTVGGAIAARFASDHGHRLGGLVLVDTFGLAPFEPAPEFGLALSDYLAEPTERTHDRFWRRCMFDLDTVRDRMGERWEPFKAYSIDRVGTPSVMAALGVLMEQFGAPIAPADLTRIDVPTTLIWGRHDLATPLQVAEAASARHGWPLHVIEDSADEPTFEQPEAFLRVLRIALEDLTKERAA